MTLCEKMAEIEVRERNSLTVGPADDRDLIDLINDNIALNLDGELSAFAAARFNEIGEDAYWREYNDVLINGNSSYDFSDLSWDEGISRRQQRFWGRLLAEGLRLSRGSQRERCINHLKVPGHRGAVLRVLVSRRIPGLAELLRDDLVALADTHNWMPSEANALAVVLWDLKVENAKQIIFRLAQRVEDESRRWSKDIRLVVE